MVDVEQIKTLLRQAFIVTGNVTINPKNGLVSVTGSVTLRSLIRFAEFPVSFEEVGRDFDCGNNLLKSLVGAPTSVGGGFNCNHNQLVSLDGAPTSVGGSFNCNHNQLVSLEGAPSQVGESFYAGYNKLIDLSGAPSKIHGTFDCSINQLASLDGSPTQVGDDFKCDHNPLTDFKGAPDRVGGSFFCRHNKLSSLDGAPRVIGGSFVMSYSEDLPLLRVLTYQTFALYGMPRGMVSIFDKHAGTGRRGAIQAAKEIIDLGEIVKAKLSLETNPFEANARW